MRAVVVRRRALWVAGGVLVVIVAAGAWLLSRLYASLPVLEGEVALNGLAESVIVERDSLGVPTLRGGDRIDLARATGFVHAQDRYFQMDLLRRQAAGELAELVGGAAFESDRDKRVHRFRARAEHVVAEASADERRLIAAYVEGVNQGLRALGSKPPEYWLLGAEPAPWSAADTFLVAYAMFFELQDERGSREAALGTLADVFPPPVFGFLAPLTSEWEAPIRGPVGEAPPVPDPQWLDLRGREPAAAARRHVADPAADLLGYAAAAGSNNWALAGEHTSWGGALVAGDMHLGLALPNVWYRLSLEVVGDAGRIVTGVTLPGTPFVIAGSNGAVAWAFTNTWGDWADLVVLEESGSGYRTPDGERAFDRFLETIAVRGEPARQIEVLETVWGPVIDRDPAGRRRALRWVAHDRQAVNSGLFGLETVRDVEQALAVAHRSGVPQQNFTVGDASGRIAWTVIGPLPRRFGHDGRIPSSWADGARGWDGYLTPSEVPVLVDPPDGRLWTANARVVTDEGAALIGDGGMALGARGRQIRDLLAGVERAGPPDMLRMQLDDRALLLDRWWRLAGVVAAARGDPALGALLEGSWTGRASIDSQAYRIVRAFRAEVEATVFEALTVDCRDRDPSFAWRRLPRREVPLWQLVDERPLHLLAPAYGSWEELLGAALDRAVEGLVASAGGLERATWGARNTVRVHHPLARAVPSLGRWLNLPDEPLPGDLFMPRFQAPAAGASQRMALAPGRERESLFHMPGGQSGHPLSPFYDAGHDAWAHGRAQPFLPGPAVHRLRLTPP